MIGVYIAGVAGNDACPNGTVVGDILGNDLGNNEAHGINNDGYRTVNATGKD